MTDNQNNNHDANNRNQENSTHYGPIRRRRNRFLDNLMFHLRHARQRLAGFADHLQSLPRTQMDDLLNPNEHDPYEHKEGQFFRSLLLGPTPTSSAIDSDDEEKLPSRTAPSSEIPSYTPQSTPRISASIVVTNNGNDNIEPLPPVANVGSAPTVISSSSSSESSSGSNNSPEPPTSST